MGAKSWFLAVTDGDARELLLAKPELDRDASINLAKQLFPDTDFEEIGDGDLYDLSPDDDEVVVGVFPGISIVGASEFGIDYPSTLDQRFIELGKNRRVLLHAMHSVVDWFAFAVWDNGKLIRALSLSPDSGILEDFGERLDFEVPFWNGDHPAIDEDDDDEEDPYPFVFHPLELAEETLLELLGFQFEGLIADSLFDAEEITLLKLKRKPKSKSWWKFW